VEVHREEAVGAGSGQQVGHQTARDRHPRLVFLVGTTVAVIGDHGGDPARRGAFEGVDEDEELHQAGVHRPGDGLDDEDVLLAHVFEDAHEEVFVGELEGLRVAERLTQVVADCVG